MPRLPQLNPKGKVQSRGGTGTSGVAQGTLGTAQGTQEQSSERQNTAAQNTALRTSVWSPDNSV